MQIIVTVVIVAVTSMKKMTHCLNISGSGTESADGTVFSEESIQVLDGGFDLAL